MNDRENDQATAFAVGRRGVLRGMVAAPLAFSLTGCGGFNTASYRLRMTVEADTSAGVRSGSSVMEITAERQEKFVSEARPLISSLRGEAVVVDTPSGPVFVLLKLPSSDHTFLQALTFALALDLRDGGWEPFWKAVNRLSGWFASAKAELPREDWPMMVRFGDINDARSVEQVDPVATGVGRILLETTKDGVTTGLRKRLPWLTDGGLTLDPASGPTIHPTFAQTLRQRDFDTKLER